MQHKNKEKQRESQEYQAHCAPKPQIKTSNIPNEVSNSITERNSYGFGTTTNSLTPEINPFQYAIESKCLTLKDQTSYLIPDG